MANKKTFEIAIDLIKRTNGTKVNGENWVCFTLVMHQVIPNGDDLPVKPFKLSVFLEHAAGLVKLLKPIDGKNDEFTLEDKSWKTSGYRPGMEDYALGQRRMCSETVQLDGIYARKEKNGTYRQVNGQILLRDTLKIYWIEFWDGDEWSSPDGFGREETLHRVLNTWYRKYEPAVKAAPKVDVAPEDDNH